MITILTICACILCAVSIFLTWRTEFSKREIKRLRDELYITQVKLENLRSVVEDLSWGQIGGLNDKNRK